MFVTIRVPEQFAQVATQHEKRQRKNRSNPTGSSDQKAAKEWKKYRKDQRRKYRRKYPGMPEDNVVFLNDSSMKDPVHIHIEKGAPSVVADKKSNHQQDNNKKPKRQFPCINDMVKLQEEKEKFLSDQQERKEQWETVSEEEKSKYLALDCEMVGVGADGKTSRLARATVVNWDHEILLDTFVKVPEKVTDFRTWVSGVRPKDIRPGINSQAMDLNECRRKVGNLIKDKIVVGHSLKNDFRALILDQPRSQVRDTALYPPYMKRVVHKKNPEKVGKLRSRKLKDLALEKLGQSIQQEGEAHTPVEDAIAAMDLYKLERNTWEKELERKQKGKRKH